MLRNCHIPASTFHNNIDLVIWFSIIFLSQTWFRNVWCNSKLRVRTFKKKIKKSIIDKKKNVLCEAMQSKLRTTIPQGYSLSNDLRFKPISCTWAL